MRLFFLSFTHLSLTFFFGIQLYKAALALIVETLFYCLCHKDRFIMSNILDFLSFFCLSFSSLSIASLFYGQLVHVIIYL